MFNNLKKTAGNTVIEILIATVIVAVVLTALAASMTQSIHNSAEAEYRQIAARLGQDVIEVFRQDKNIYSWEEFSGVALLPNTASETMVYCVPSTLTKISDIPASAIAVTSISTCSLPVTSNNMIFHRAVSKTPVSGLPNSIKITVTTSWNAADPVRKRTVELQQIFYKPSN